MFYHKRAASGKTDSPSLIYKIEKGQFTKPDEVGL